MNAVVPEVNSSRLDSLKWLLVALLVAGGIFGNFYFGAQPILYRAVALVVIAAIAGYMALNTTKGAVFLSLLKGAKVEARRVVWPTKQECNQTSLVVVAFILIMALILWLLDSLLGWLTSLVIG
jgi:preprotein translocase subunit SecE